jgi:hypothetical protein
MMGLNIGYILENGKEIIEDIQSMIILIYKIEID